MSRRSDRVRAAIGVVGELLITAGVVVGLFAVYTLYWTGIETANEQDALEAEFEAASPAEVPPTRPASQDAPEPVASDQPAEEPAADETTESLPGSAYARMTIPRLGEDWSWIVVEGVATDDLTRGPGHYPETAGPGEVGNFAIAGHRATYGEPFAYLDRVQIGDDILVERQGMLHRYAVTESFITLPTDVDVIAPVPGRPGQTPQEEVITLTTCNPRFSGAERLIVHGTLVESVQVGTAEAAGVAEDDAA